MSRHQGDGYSMGQRPKVMPVFNRQMAEEWVSRMQNADGTRGPHFSMEKAKEVMKQYNVDCDPTEFWVVINTLYSNYDQALKKNNASTLELYACLAKAWIEDQDAVPDKASACYTYVVRHLKNRGEKKISGFSLSKRGLSVFITRQATKLMRDKM